MKIGIVTVYNSENCGSFLQAYALSQALQNENRDVVFLKQNFKEHSGSIQNYLKIVIKTLIRGDFSGAKRICQRRAIFKKAHQKFNIADNYDDIDCFILGSDVIWDVTVPFFKKHYPFFWGTQFKNQKVISYAASVGFAEKRHLIECDFVSDALRKMHSISVRDEASKCLLSPYSNKDIQMVCDPTYLLDRKEYDFIAESIDLHEFIFLYYYENMSNEYRSEIQILAEKEGLKVVTFGNFNTWCDLNLPYDPLTFLSMCDKAKYIVTNTFHGTVFSTIYEKKFAVINTNKQKILDVLEKCAMSDKMTKQEHEISMVLHSEFDYETARKNIEKLRKKSLNYLHNALLGGEKNS